MHKNLFFAFCPFMFSVGEGKRFEVVQFGSSKRKKSGFKYMADEGWVKCKREIDF